MPSAVVDQALGDLVPLLDSGDVVVDGGNSYFRDYVPRGSELRARGIRYLDVGTSGGVAGLERGYCLMIGGDADTFEHLRPIFASPAPGVAAAPLTPGRSDSRSSAEEGFLHCGPQGAGHFVIQPRKVQRSGLWDAVAGRVLIYIHKEQMLDAVQRHYPARHYVMVDNKLRILAAMKKVLKERLTTVFPRQGHYALDPAAAAAYPAADISIERIDDLLSVDIRELSGSKDPATASQGTP